MRVIKITFLQTFLFKEMLMCEIRSGLNIILKIWDYPDNQLNFLSLF